MSQKRSPADGDNIYRILFPSLLGIVLCAICLAGTTFAWFSATNTASTVPIRTATYNISIEATDSADSTVVTANAKEAFSLRANEAYTLTFSATGTATEGYCTLTLTDGTHLQTEQIAPGKSITLSITPEQDLTLTPEACWGIAETADLKDGESYRITSNGDCIPTT